MTKIQRHSLTIRNFSFEIKIIETYFNPTNIHQNKSLLLLLIKRNAFQFKVIGEELLSINMSHWILLIFYLLVAFSEIRALNFIPSQHNDNKVYSNQATKGRTQINRSKFSGLNQQCKSID